MVLFLLVISWQSGDLTNVTQLSCQLAFSQLAEVLNTGGARGQNGVILGTVCCKADSYTNVFLSLSGTPPGWVFFYITMRKGHSDMVSMATVTTIKITYLGSYLRNQLTQSDNIGVYDYVFCQGIKLCHQTKCYDCYIAKSKMASKMAVIINPQYLSNYMT